MYCKFRLLFFTCCLSAVTCSFSVFDGFFHYCMLMTDVVTVTIRSFIFKKRYCDMNYIYTPCNHRFYTLYNYIIISCLSIFCCVEWPYQEISVCKFSLLPSVDSWACSISRKLMLLQHLRFPLYKIE